VIIVFPLPKNTKATAFGGGFVLKLDLLYKAAADGIAPIMAIMLLIRIAEAGTLAVAVETEDSR